MTILSIVNPVFVIAGLERLGGSAAPQPVPLYELGMAAIAIGVWAVAVAVIAAWLRARERKAARAHIRSILIVRQDGGASSGMEQRQMENRTRQRQAWARPVQQI